MKKIILSLTTVFALFACVTTPYRKPLQLTQKEIANFKVVDRHSVQQNMGPGKIRDCDSMKHYFGVNDCAIVICKENPMAETKLDCEVYIPESVDEFRGKNALLGISNYKNKDELQIIRTLLKDFDDGNENKLIAYCNKENVMCYMNAKFFPENKVPANYNPEVIIHRGSHILKNKSKIEITVFGMK